MKKNTIKTIRRVVSIVALLLVLSALLVSCGGGSKVVKPTVNTDAFLDLDENCTLKGGQLNSIANMLAEVYDTDFNTQELLIAAYRGYDMLAEDFDESTIDFSEAREPDMTAIVRLIEKAALMDKAYPEVKLIEYQSMTAADALVIIQSMQTTVELDGSRGALDTLLGWIGTFLGWMTNTLCFGSYIAGICLFAVLVEILMLPLSIKQQKSSIKQAKLAPKEMAIKKKYAGRNDQVTMQKMNAELQELRQRENVNPAAGCLPLLIQLPIVMALYNIVIDPLRYVLGQAPALSNALYSFFAASPAAGGLGMDVNAGRGTIAMLSQLSDHNLDGLKDFLFFTNGDAVSSTVESLQSRMPDFTLGNINLGLNPDVSQPSILWLVPVITFVVYFFSMRLTKKFTYQPVMAQNQQTACSGWLMDIYMPGISTFFAFMLPALVGVYWAFKSVISTLRQYIVCRVMPYPKFTEEDYRAAEREYAGKAPARRTETATRSYGRDVTMVGGKPKSLFHMDDDDYLAKVEAEEQAQKEETESNPAPNARLSGGIALKEDDRPARKKKSKTKTESEETSATDTSADADDQQ